MTCSAQTRRATWTDPPEFCERDSLPSGLCPGHDPDAIAEQEIERVESLREEGGFRSWI